MRFRCIEGMSRLNSASGHCISMIFSIQIKPYPLERIQCICLVRILACLKLCRDYCISHVLRSYYRVDHRAIEV